MQKTRQELVVQKKGASKRALEDRKRNTHFFTYFGGSGCRAQTAKSYSLQEAKRGPPKGMRETSQSGKAASLDAFSNAMAFVGDAR